MIEPEEPPSGQFAVNLIIAGLLLGICYLAIFWWLNQSGVYSPFGTEDFGTKNF